MVAMIFAGSRCRQSADGGVPAAGVSAGWDAGFGVSKLCG